VSTAPAHTKVSCTSSATRLGDSIAPSAARAGCVCNVSPEFETTGWTFAALPGDEGGERTVAGLGSLGLLPLLLELLLRACARLRLTKRLAMPGKVRICLRCDGAGEDCVLGEAGGGETVADMT
jgi:hypothetical protein